MKKNTKIYPNVSVRTTLWIRASKMHSPTHFQFYKEITSLEKLLSNICFDVALSVGETVPEFKI